MDTPAQPLDFESVFQLHYERIARLTARIVRDTARAEELAVEVFWKYWRTPRAHGPRAGAWLYRVAVRTALNDLRAESRRARYESMSDPPPAALTPEQAHAAAEERGQVRRTLAVLDPRQAELLLLRGSGLSYEEVASALELNPASVGTLIARAQQAFRKEYVKEYGEPR